ncbi:hypothetical protein [Aminipila butyrica]|nr:hypothetical protein [Aminipila butyrica]
MEKWNKEDKIKECPQAKGNDMGESEKLLTFLPRYRVCIDSRYKGALEGRVFFGYRKWDGMRFADVHELLFLLEKVMDQLNCPAAANEMRHFRTEKESYRKKEKNANSSSAEIREAKRAMRKFDTGSERGQKATFILQIKFRQNASWQGTVQWVEKKQELNFRSALELIKIIDSACEEGYQTEVLGLDDKIG